VGLNYKLQTLTLFYYLSIQYRLAILLKFEVHSHHIKDCIMLMLNLLFVVTNISYHLTDGNKNSLLNYLLTFYNLGIVDFPTRLQNRLNSAIDNIFIEHS
jgi:hypothetical protein